jgi:hypothetical protein
MSSDVILLFAVLCGLLCGRVARVSVLKLKQRAPEKDEPEEQVPSSKLSKLCELHTAACTF